MSAARASATRRIMLRALGVFALARAATAALSAASREEENWAQTQGWREEIGVGAGAGAARGASAAAHGV